MIKLCISNKPFTFIIHFRTPCRATEVAGKLVWWSSVPALVGGLRPDGGGWWRTVTAGTSGRCTWLLWCSALLPAIQLSQQDGQRRSYVGHPAGSSDAGYFDSGASPSEMARHGGLDGEPEPSAEEVHQALDGAETDLWRGEVALQGGQEKGMEKVSNNYSNNYSNNLSEI